MAQVSHAFDLIAQICIALGENPLNRWPECWHCKIDDRWEVWVNGFSEVRNTSEGTEVPGYTAYIQYNGWPAGFIDPYGGVLAGGEAACEDTLIEALKLKLATISN